MGCYGGQLTGFRDNRPAYYQLHKIVTIPGYELASKTPMKKRRAYIPSTEWLTAIKPALISLVTSSMRLHTREDSPSQL
jgi:hypothetical protein